MVKSRRLASVVTLLAVTAILATSCAQESTGGSAGGSTLDCSKSSLALKNAGKLTIATSNPAYPPYVLKNDPTNGKGFESAVAYAVAQQLGFSHDEVNWTFSPFAKLFAPGDKDFDFALNQISINPNRAQRVTFSDPYYEAANAVLVLDNSSYAHAQTIADLKGAKFGVQQSTTSLDVLTTLVQPSQSPAVYPDTNTAVQALKNGQIDALVTDLPTAIYLQAVEVNNSTVVGQFPPQANADTWGLVMQKGSSLATCVDQALGALNSNGQLTAITKKWMADYTKAPVLS